MIREVFVSALALAAGGICTAHAADAWPTRPIRMIVPFPPGGGTDTFARPLGTKLSEQLGQQIVIDNRGGAGGTLGAALAAKAPADGDTWLMGAVHHTVAVSAYKSLPYDLDRDLRPVTGVAYVPDVLVINLQVPAKTVKELIAWAKSNPTKVNYGSSGQGTTRHLSGELFNALTGTKMVHVPYKGSGPAMTGLMGGEVALIFEGLGSAATHIRSGRVRALAATRGLLGATGRGARGRADGTVRAVREGGNAALGQDRPRQRSDGRVAPLNPPWHRRP